MNKSVEKDVYSMEMNEIKQKVLEDVDPEIHRLKKKKEGNIVRL